MVVNNKVLTVSYGTFSCTLEGFDDSFGTMKAIAEYFRDLAADDRYFGAEPPQPDVDMLARIAQREITRQVEAHSTETGGIVLRASDTNDAPAVAAPSPVPVQEPTAEPTIEAEVAPVDVASVAAQAPAPVIELPEVIEDVAQAAPMIVAEVEEISAPVSAPEETPVSEVAEATEVTLEDVVEASDEDAPVEDVIQDAAIAAPQETEATTAESAVAEPIELASVTEPASDTTEENSLETPVLETPVAEDVHKPEIVPAVDSIAAKLLRIRAVVSQNDSLAPTDDYVEDEEAENFVQAKVLDINGVLNSNDDVQPTPETHEVEDEVSNVLDQLDAIADSTENKADDKTEIMAGGADDTVEEFFADKGEDRDDALFDDADDLQGDDELSVDEISDILQAQPFDQDIEEPTVHVAKVKRVDLEAAISTAQMASVAKGQVEPLGDEAAAPDPIEDDSADQTDGSLTPEDEADLMRELAAVEDELSNDPDADEADDNIFGDDIDSEVVDDTADENAAHAGLSDFVDEDEADLSRLMDTADEKLDDPENSSRRDAYSHLRGAVAAAEAEKSAGGSVGDTTTDDAYRSDLADVVRPRRPAIEGDRTERAAADARPAPLKLVAEQRVDEGAGLGQRGPVRPRRVMTVPAAPGSVSEATGADSAFAAFAERVGATELPELLEAAAAYLSFVEGQDKFSRPQLMNKVRLVKQDDYNREDGLRSFGQLLRDGKIEKRGGGRFAASVEIGFRPDPTNDEDARDVG